MKLFAYLVGSAIYIAAGAFIWLLILLQCGMGPDSPVACNEKADFQAQLFAFAAVGLFLVLSFIYWRRRGAGAR